MAHPRTHFPAHTASSKRGETTFTSGEVSGERPELSEAECDIDTIKKLMLDVIY
jgi:hypothetical protein